MTHMQVYPLDSCGRRGKQEAMTRRTHNHSRVSTLEEWAPGTVHKALALPGYL